MVVIDGQPAQATSQEMKGVGATILVEVVVIAVAVVAVIGTSERSLSSWIAEGGSTMGVIAGSITRRVHGRIPGSATETGRKSVAARMRTSELLTKPCAGAESTSRSSERTRTRSAGHRTRTHTEAGRSFHGRGKGRVSDDGSSGARTAAAQTANVLREVVVSAALRTTFPVTGTEGDNASITAHATAVTVSSTMAVMATMVRRRHRRWGTVSVGRVAHRVGRSSTHSGEGASEASGAALEVGEAARRTGPVTRTGTVLARRERREDLGGTVENAAGRWRNLDGLFVQGSAVHTQAFGSLEVQEVSILNFPAFEKAISYFFMRGEHGETSSSRLVLVGCSQGPESNRATAELGEPALKLRLRSIVRKTAHVKNLATLRQERTNIGSGVHGASQDLGMLVSWLRFTDQTLENASKCDSLFHRPARRGRSKSLEVERKIVLDRRGRLDGFDLKSSTDVGERGRRERKRFGVVSLPALVFGTEIEGS